MIRRVVTGILVRLKHQLGQRTKTPETRVIDWPRPWKDRRLRINPCEHSPDPYNFSMYKTSLYPLGFQVYKTKKPRHYDENDYCDKL